MTSRYFRACVLFSILAVTSVATLADTLTYEYDALGRLEEVRYPNGSVVSYTLDPAGNREKVASLTLPGVPASITVPSSSSTGSYTISWGEVSETVTAYKLYEATSSNFSGQVQIYSGTGLSHAITGKTNGTYYYRVRACNDTLCSSYRTGANATTVNLVPPAAPASITGPFQTTGSYTISWASSAGATRYELWENFFGGAFSKIYDGPNTTKSFNNKPSGEYRYKAKACNAAGCSAFSPTKLVTVCSPQCLGPEGPGE